MYDRSNDFVCLICRKLENTNPVEYHQFTSHSESITICLFFEDRNVEAVIMLNVLCPFKTLQVVNSTSLILILVVIVFFLIKQFFYYKRRYVHFFKDLYYLTFIY